MLYLLNMNIQIPKKQKKIYIYIYKWIVIDYYCLLVRKELGALKKSALLKRALQAGVDDEELQEADEADDPKQELIKLVLAKESDAPDFSS